MSLTNSILRATPRDSALVKAILDRLPEFEGRPIRLGFLPSLRARRGRLHSGDRQPGTPVHAASFIRARRIVMDRALFDQASRLGRGEFTRVLLHELFHFVWVRLGNPARDSFQRLIRHEMLARATGELGWSAESRKRIPLLKPSKSRLWREYVCESFCDTGAWLYAGTKCHDEITLARRHRDRRAEWFALQFSGRPIPL